MNYDSNWQDLRQAMNACRRETLRLLSCIPDDPLGQLLHPEFSPLGWHFGHIAYTEALWLLPPPLQAEFNLPRYCQLFRADSLPKAERCHLPDRPTLIQYLARVREAVWQQWPPSSPTDERQRLWAWLLQHETQHGETIAFLSQLGGLAVGRQSLELSGISSNATTKAVEAEMVSIPAGGFWQGSNAVWAQDNERPTHWQEVPRFWLDVYPVTRQQYQEFSEAGGYHQAKYWSAEGWQWRQVNQIEAPLYWSDTRLEQQANEPVSGVSAYEAEAYAQFVGKRLPTETEWEKAAAFIPSSHVPPVGGVNHSGQNVPNANAQWGQTTPVDHQSAGVSLYGNYGMLGNVWEWTASTFAPYPDFAPYPYPSYSQAYFDGRHRVLRGGSWATRPWGLRPSFRNWYYPWVRQIIAGFRCAS